MKKTFYFIALLLIINCDTENQNEFVSNVDSKITYYENSDEVISNPERGFMYLFPAKDSNDPILETSLGKLKKENVTLIQRLYYLESYRDSDIDNAFLNMIKADMNNIRKAGIKCILRFSYSDGLNKPDAPLNIVERHLDQLENIFEENTDVIAFLQAGFVGAWGEWHASTNNLTSIENAKKITYKLLQTLPKNIKIQLRTPSYKQKIFDYKTAITSKIGYSDVDRARVGFHNDCFLSSKDDYGTYIDIIKDKKFISDEALFVPTGGETCPPAKGWPKPNCTITKNEMEELKWTYLNLNWYIPVINAWKDEGCFKTLQKKLGYRLSLEYSKLKSKLNSSESFKIEIRFKNSGFAPIYNKKNVFLIFKSTNTPKIYKKKLDFDIRKIIPKNTFDVKEEIKISEIQSGEYELFLKIEDTSKKIANKPEFCIQLANKNTWESGTGLNKLNHKVSIQKTP